MPTWTITIRRDKDGKEFDITCVTQPGLTRDELDDEFLKAIKPYTTRGDWRFTYAKDY